MFHKTAVLTSVHENWPCFINFHMNYLIFVIAGFSKIIYFRRKKSFFSRFQQSEWVSGTKLLTELCLNRSRFMTKSVKKIRFSKEYIPRIYNFNEIRQTSQKKLLSILVNIYRISTIKSTYPSKLSINFCNVSSIVDKGIVVS